MKPVYGILFGVAFVGVAVSVAADGIMRWAASSTQERGWLLQARDHAGRIDSIVADQGPIEPPAGTTTMNVRVKADANMASLKLRGYKALLVASKKSAKTKKDVVIPVAMDALILTSEPSGSASDELLLSLAVPEDQVEKLLWATDYGVELELKLPGCGGWVPRETDSAVFLAAPKSTEELQVMLDTE